MSACWIAVACAAHVARGRAGGFMQVCHGKAAPLRRLKAGDRVAYYSPVETMEGREPCQAFTACGVVHDDDVHQVAMTPDFRPWRRAVDWRPAEPAPIRSLLPKLDLTRERPNWGGAFRFGLVRITEPDMDLIAAAMKAA